MQINYVNFLLNNYAVFIIMYVQISKTDCLHIIKLFGIDSIGIVQLFSRFLLCFLKKNEIIPIGIYSEQFHKS